MRINSKANQSGNIRHQTAHILRRLSAEVTSCDAPDELFAEMADRVERLCADLVDKPTHFREIGSFKNKQVEGKRIFDYGIKDLSPFSGLANPLAPPLRLVKHERETAEARVIFPACYEGPAGCVHQGFIAGTFDEFLGYVQSRRSRPVMTGILDIHFHEQCPVNTEVSLEGHVKRAESSLVFTLAYMRAGHRLIAEAEAVFFVIDVDKYKGFAQERNQKLKSKI